MNELTMSTSIATPPIGLSSILGSSPLILCAGVTGFVGALDSVYANGTLSSKSSSSLGVDSLWGSSPPASSGYRPRSDAGRGVRGCFGGSLNDASMRWNCASDWTSFSCICDSATSERMRGIRTCLRVREWPRTCVCLAGGIVKVRKRRAGGGEEEELGSGKRGAGQTER